MVIALTLVYASTLASLCELGLAPERLCNGSNPRPRLQGNRHREGRRRREDRAITFTSNTRYYNTMIIIDMLLTSLVL